jgi:hypothetical protein
MDEFLDIHTQAKLTYKDIKTRTLMTSCVCESVLMFPYKEKIGDQAWWCIPIIPITDRGLSLHELRYTDYKQ